MRIRAVLVSPLGFLIGLSLGALGGGGSILAVPALVYGAGQSPKQATTTSLVLVGLTALMGIAPHWRAGRVRLVPGVLFGFAGIGGSLLGSRWNNSVDPNVLLLLFSALMIVAAIGMWKRAGSSSAPSPSAAEFDDVALPRSGPRASRVGASVSGASVSTVVKVAAAGSVVGLLTGFFGVGGGFVIVPALVLTLGFAMPEAVGTSLLVIAVNAAVALSTRLRGGELAWEMIVPFTAASLSGMLVGVRLAGTREPRTLQRWFVVLLVVVALYTAIRSGISS